MFEQNFWMKCQIRSGECLWHKNLKSYLRWVLWSSKVNQYKETMTNDQSHEIDEITYARGGEGS